jgi:hypothetical protein
MTKQTQTHTHTGRKRKKDKQRKEIEILDKGLHTASSLTNSLRHK